MTETKKRKAESVQVLDAKIAEMEAELADGHGRPLSWDEVTSASSCGPPWRGLPTSRTATRASGRARSSTSCRLARRT